MFDLNDEENTRVKKGLPARLADDDVAYGEFVGDQDDDQEPKGNVLDDDVHHRLHGQLLGFYQRELDRQNENRIQQAIDEDYYDNDQWSEEDAQTLKDRGQAPICYNVISQTINWIIGSEKRGRTDFNVLPRGKEDAKPAEKKTQLLKYLSDVNRTPFHRSRAFEDSTKVGIGWLEDGVTDDDDKEPVYSRYESWRNMLWDSASTEYDIEDARYVIRNKWVDLDVSIAYFPDRADLLERSASASDRYGADLANGDEVMDFAEDERETLSRGVSEHSANRQRVRLIEVWFKKPEKVQKIIGGPRSGEIVDPNNPQHAEAVQAGMVGQRMMMRMHVAIMTTSGLCWVGPSPYRHNRFPFTPLWGYRRGRDGLPYGVIRALRDIQDDINKRASKAQFILSTNKTIMEEGAVEDMAHFMEEVARPDGVIVVKPNKRLDINVDRELAASHMQLMSQGISMIQSVSGVTDELMGRTTNAKSGVAIQARQEQGSMSTSKLFDNLRFAVQTQGEKQLSLVEQYFTDQKQFRITNQRMTPEYVDINDGLPENDITRTKADFIISDAEWRASLRQAQAEQLMEMMTRLPPEVALVMLDLVVESMDLPNREELVKRIRQVSGQRDPDATELTPEEQQAEAAKQQQAQYAQQVADAQLRGMIAKAVKDEVGAQKTMTDMAGVNVNTQKAAVETAQTAMIAPGILPVADALLKESGFVSASEEQAQQEAAQQQQIAHQQQAQQQQQAEQAQQEQQDQQQGMQGGIESMQQQAAPFGAAQPQA
jgi:hypothetical protein